MCAFSCLMSMSTPTPLASRPGFARAEPLRHMRRSQISMSGNRDRPARCAPRGLARGRKQRALEGDLSYQMAGLCFSYCLRAGGGSDVPGMRSGWRTRIGTDHGTAPARGTVQEHLHLPAILVSRPHRFFWCEFARERADLGPVRGGRAGRGLSALPSLFRIAACTRGSV